MLKSFLLKRITRNFWTTLPKPFMALAPMENVTDFVFREIVTTKLPRPEVFFTEFTSAEGLISEGYEATVTKFKYNQSQRPIVAQIWGTNPEALFKAARIANKLKFDGIDINMGCPDRNVMKNGAGAGLIKNPALARDIILAVSEGAKGIPVSIKTRIEINSLLTEKWISFLLEQKIDAITIHARTAKQRPEIAANWEEIGKAVEIKNKISPTTIIIGNGDVESYKTVMDYHFRYRIDGVMIGRGILKNPWVFEKLTEPLVRSREKYIEVLLKHLDLYEKTWGERKSFDPMKKFFKMYVNTFPGANILRQKLMETKTIKEAKESLFNKS